MAQREAGIRVTMKSAGFMSGLRQMTTAVNAAGTKMGSALSAPMIAGIASAKGAMSNMFGELGGHLKTAATLGGAFAVGKFVSDAVSMQHTYRNIATTVNRVKGNSEDWRSVMASIEPIANKTGQTTAAMAASFQTVFGATGDLEYSKRTMEAIGTAATATGIEANQLGTAMQLAYRKFGIGSQDAEKAVAAFVEKVGVGGLGADALGNEFADMAGEASTAGMKGVDGMSTLLGVMLALDSAVGEKATPGLKMMFQSLKNNTAMLANMEKAAGIKFNPDMTAFDKMRKLLESEKGRVTAKMTFTADSRVVYDTLSQPFEAAYKQAIDQGKSTKEATQAGLAAYDESLKKMGSSSMKFSTLQDQANERLKKDPTVMMRNALNKMASAFNNEEMMNAVGRLAELLPPLASGFVKLFDLAMRHPLLAIGTGVMLKMAVAFASSAIQTAAIQWSTSAMASLTPILHSSAFTAGTKMGMAAKGGLIAAAAAIGIVIGNEIAKAYWDEKHALETKGQTAEIGAFNAQSGSMSEKEEALTALNSSIQELKEGGLLGKVGLGGLGQFYNDASATLANAAGSDVGYTDTTADRIAKMEAEARSLEASIQKQKQATTSTAKTAEAMDKATEAVNKFTKATGASNSGPPRPLPVIPGHAAPGQ